jgi:hypothetical protein
LCTCQQDLVDRVAAHAYRMTQRIAK